MSKSIALKVPNHTPYLSNSWDRMDEYHSLNSSVTEEQFATWWAVVFKRGKIKTLEDALKFPKYELLCITQSNESGFYGCWTVDLYGGYFGTMGMYIQSFYLEYFPENLNNTAKKTNKRDRFNYIQELIKKYYPQHEPDSLAE